MTSASSIASSALRSYAQQSLVSVFATQEIDVNRGWKRTAGEPAVSPTSTFATLTVDRPTRSLSMAAWITGATFACTGIL